MRALVRALWPQETAGFFTVWAYPSRASYHLPLFLARDLPDDEFNGLQVLNEDQCIYFGLGLRRGGLSQACQGGKSDIVALPGIALDIDVYDPKAHKATNLPKTEDDVFEILAPFPAPSLVVHTGHGYHCYWLLTAPLCLVSDLQRKEAGQAFQRFQRPYIERAASLGWHIDATHSINRVWRVPGFLNRKYEPSGPVTIEDQSEDRYTLDD